MGRPVEEGSTRAPWSGSLHLVLEPPLSALHLAVDLAFVVVIGWLVVALRRARQRLTHSDARLATRTAELEAVPIGFVVHDPEGQVIDANPRAKEILGDAPVSLLIGSKEANGWRLLPGDDLAPEEAPSPDAQRFGSCQEFHPVVVGIESPNFETTWIELQTVPLLQPGSEVPSATLSAFCDVTARVEQDARAKVESERLRGMLDSMDDVIWSFDAATRTPRFLSRGVEALLGRSVQELMRQPRLMLEAVHPDDRKLVEEARDELEQVGALTMEYRIVRADGTVRWVQERCRMSFTGEGHPSLIEGITTDVTERQAAQAAVTRATAVALENARMKSEFLANMSHEIRTPLNGILGMSDLALQAPLPPDLRDYLKTIRASGESLLLTLNNLIDFSVLESGRVDLDKVPFRLADTIAEALRAITPRCQLKGVELLATIDPALPLDRVGDPERLRQILVHLLDNAIKFTEDGEIELSAALDTRADTSIRFTVRDSGIGIEPAQANRIFDAFVQADGSHTRRHGGNGLGLAIAAELVHLMHGEIWLDTDVGQGSTFHFVITLPFAVTATSSRPDPVLDSLNGRTALLVDDHEGARRELARQLSALGIRVLSTGSSDVAIATIRQSAAERVPIDLLFVDSTLEGVDGFDLDAPPATSTGGAGGHGDVDHAEYWARGATGPGGRTACTCRSRFWPNRSMSDWQRAYDARRWPGRARRFPSPRTTANDAPPLHRRAREGAFFSRGQPGESEAGGAIARAPRLRRDGGGERHGRSRPISRTRTTSCSWTRRCR
ncbi:MAG: ATP-binding protein [Candidatus Eisenbacteria bacterium]